MKDRASELLEAYADLMGRIEEMPIADAFSELYDLVDLMAEALQEATRG